VSNLARGRVSRAAVVRRAKRSKVSVVRTAPIRPRDGSPADRATVAPTTVATRPHRPARCSRSCRARSPESRGATEGRARSPRPERAPGRPRETRAAAEAPRRSRRGRRREVPMPRGPAARTPRPRGKRSRRGQREGHGGTARRGSVDRPWPIEQAQLTGNRCGGARVYLGSTPVPRNRPRVLSGQRLSTGASITQTARGSE
jgi:hypothetical protein